MNSDKKNNFKIIASICLILTITFISFYPSLKNDFTNWDDDRDVTGNPLVRSLSLNNLRTIFTSFIHNLYSPLTVFSFAVEYHFFQYQPFIYHLDNLILHLLNCLLVFWLIYLIAGKISVALITAILFGIHPLHVESVAWVTERKDVLYSFFFLGALISYIYYLNKKADSRYYYLAILIFILSLLSKGMAASFSLILFLIDYITYRKYDKMMILDKIPFFILSICFGIIAIFGYNTIQAKEQWNVLHRLMLSIHAISFYLNKIFVPINLSCLYPSFGIKTISPYSLLIVGILLIAIIYSIKHTRKIIFGSLFFLFAMSPVLLFVRKTATLVADRYTYISSIGIFYIIGVVIFWIYKKKLRFHLFRPILLTILVVVLVLLSFLTWNRCKVWKDSITLWKDAIEKMPLNPIAYYGLGCAYSDLGKTQEAIEAYLQAIKIRPGYLVVYTRLAEVYAYSGHIDKAVNVWNRVLQINPHVALAHARLSGLYFEKRQYDLAIKHCDKVIELGYEIDPEFLELLKPFRQ